MLIDKDFERWYADKTGVHLVEKKSESEKSMDDLEPIVHDDTTANEWENEGGAIHPDYKELTREDLKMWEKDVTISNQVKVKNLYKLIRNFLKR